MFLDRQAVYGLLWCHLSITRLTAIFQTGNTPSLCLKQGKPEKECLPCKSRAPCPSLFQKIKIKISTLRNALCSNDRWASLVINLLGFYVLFNFAYLWSLVICFLWVNSVIVRQMQFWVLAECRRLSGSGLQWEEMMYTALQDQGGLLHNYRLV